ncbi:MAG: S-methyl-5-thioribose-1-phosphate isomerase [Proteobacteria bacterium]|nr:S-methyl-5-thioribose-1-phosphate isomerase [Pseudomonadota bacterium]
MALNNDDLRGDAAHPAALPPTDPRWEEVLSPLRWSEGRVVLLDQRALPSEELWRSYGSEAEVAEAIRSLVVRGAPAIGCAAALALAAGARAYPSDESGLRRAFAGGLALLRASRPTAVNLFWALERQARVFELHVAKGVEAVRDALEREALAIWREDIAACRAIGQHGAALLPDGARVLTHCNAGALATGGYGTALGVIRAAVAAGKRIQVYADETRPVLQGARLTAWELQRSGIPVTLICDNMAGHLMQRGAIDCCIVGADRVARNGDVANKIGTYMVAVLARRHGLPFYVAAPRSTIDLATPSGATIPIEERDATEVTQLSGQLVAPIGVAVRNPAFDVTPAELVTALITEAGVAAPPSEATIAQNLNDTPRRP